jgi:ABC-2 type transport system permease protein/oleandomycin transport system permease protein
MSATHATRDAWVIAGRHLTHLRQTPSLLALTIAQPAFFVVLFNYGFGGAIRVPGVDHYIDYLLPGIVILAIAFGSSQTGVAIAEDVTTGMVERLRALPIARPAMFVGRSLADTARNIGVIAIMAAFGTLLGFRFHNNAAAALTAVAVALALGLAFSWLSALIGLSVRTPETAQVATLLVVIPLAFTSSMFVPIATMPGWLQAFAKVNPITRAVDALRALTLPDTFDSDLRPAFAWIAVTLALTIPATIARYRHVNTGR